MTRDLDRLLTDPTVWAVTRWNEEDAGVNKITSVFPPDARDDRGVTLFDDEIRQVIPSGCLTELLDGGRIVLDDQVWRASQLGSRIGPGWSRERLRLIPVPREQS